MQKNTIISIIISIVIIGGTLYFVSEKPTSSENGAVSQSQNVEVKDGVQYVTVDAKGGYSPRQSIIQPNLPTKLIVKTNGTYDCSASLVIRSTGFQKILQPSGEEVIDLGTPKSGEKIQGVCGMGMYNFQIKSS
jgi:plastocyanin domain-containing protein